LKTLFWLQNHSDDFLNLFKITPKLFSQEKKLATCSLSVKSQLSGTPSFTAIDTLDACNMTKAKINAKHATPLLVLE